MTASRVSHSISSNGWMPSLVKCRLKESFRLAPTSFSLVATTTLLLDASWEGPSRWRSLWSNWGKSHRCDSRILLPEGPVCQEVRRHHFPTSCGSLSLRRRTDHNILWSGMERD